MKYSTHRVLITVIIVLGLCFFFMDKCSKSTFRIHPIKAGGDTVTVAIEYSPSGMYMDGDTLTGLNYDIANSVFRQNGIPVKIVPVASFSEGTGLLDNGDIDILIPDAAAIADLKEKYIYTEPVYIDNQVLVCKTDSADNDFSVGMLANDTVWVSYDSPFADRLNNLAREIGDTIYLREDSKAGSEGLLLKIAVGEIKQAVVNRRLAEKMINKYPELKIAGKISFSQFQAWMLSADNKALCDSMNSCISRFKKTRRYENILKGYM